MSASPRLRDRLAAAARLDRRSCTAGPTRSTSTSRGPAASASSAPAPPLVPLRAAARRSDRRRPCGATARSSATACCRSTGPPCPYAASSTSRSRGSPRPPGRAHRPRSGWPARDRAPGPSRQPGAARRARQRPHPPGRRRRSAAGWRCTAPPASRPPTTTREVRALLPRTTRLSAGPARVRAAGRGAARVLGVRHRPRHAGGGRRDRPRCAAVGHTSGLGLLAGAVAARQHLATPEGPPHDHADGRPRRGAHGRVRRLGGAAPGEPHRRRASPASWPPRSRWRPRSTSRCSRRWASTSRPAPRPRRWSSRSAWPTTHPTRSWPRAEVADRRRR